jgi:hypothetical protein
LQIAADNYALTLSKTNGGILAITDRTTNATLAVTSRNGCFWGSSYPGNSKTYLGGCNYGAGKPDSFRYTWDAVRNVLTLTYHSASTPGVDAAVNLAFQPGWFDLRLSLTNHMGATMESAFFPSDLLFSAGSVQSAYVPYYLPGARVLTGFFSGHDSISMTYPSHAFADYLAVDYAGGRLAWYSIHPDSLVAPVVFGFQDDDKTNPGSFYAFHTFQTWVPDGNRFDTPAVRVQVGASPQDSANLYRTANGIAAYPGLSDKLGDLAATLAAAPLVKMDFRSLNDSFANVSSRLGLVRAPAILHPVSYWPPAFDRNYPDFLPPDTRFGSTEDFSAFAGAAHSLGLLVMPYTNPTWWDTQSPTVVASGDIAALAVLNQGGRPVYETYGPNSGFVSSPWAPGVQNRLAALMAQWTTDVPVDLVFHDQIGSRPWLRDFNPAAPDPQSYSSHWLDFTNSYTGQYLMTEDGWDRIAATEIGFAGSLLTGATTWTPTQVRWGPGSRGNTAFGAGLWEPYPIGVWMFHDKVFFYHHDLDALPMNAGVEVLTWNAAFGVNAGYYWPELHSPNPDWAAIAAAFQPAVMSRAAGRILSAYRTVADGVTSSRFDDLSVIANWNVGSTWQVDGHTIAPSGCLARSDDGALLAGVFTGTLEGAPLSPGVHYLIIERGGEVITVRQPSGPDTSLRMALPPEWASGTAVTVHAIARDGREIGTAPLTVDGAEGSFSYARTASGVAVDHYEISPD